MTPKERVLKFERNDAGSEQKYVLVNVISKGSKSLDLKLEAIDFELCFSLRLKHDQVGSYRVKNCSASESEWRVILEKLFDQEPQLGIQASASVSADSIDLVVRKSTQGVTQRLGTITIPVTEDQFNFLEWAGTASDAVAETKKTAFEATTKVDRLETEVKELKSQLEELLQAKGDDETALLVKFRDLLNEKKVKIREQQKIMAATLVRSIHSSQSHSQQPPPEPSQTTLPSRGRKPQQSRSTKRKQPAAPVEESSDDEFEAMVVDKVKQEEETDKGADTDATASTATDDEDEGPPRSASQANTAASSQRQNSPPKKKQVTPPPRRALPFTKDKSQPAAVPKPTGDSETESDDEL